MPKKHRPKYISCTFFRILLSSKSFRRRHMFRCRQPASTGRIFSEKKTPQNYSALEFFLSLLIVVPESFSSPLVDNYCGTITKESNKTCQLIALTVINGLQSSQCHAKIETSNENARCSKSSFKINFKFSL